MGMTYQLPDLDVQYCKFYHSSFMGSCSFCDSLGDFLIPKNINTIPPIRIMKPTIKKINPINGSIFSIDPIPSGARMIPNPTMIANIPMIKFSILLLLFCKLSFSN